MKNVTLVTICTTHLEVFYKTLLSGPFQYVKVLNCFKDWLEVSGIGDLERDFEHLIVIGGWVVVLEFTVLIISKNKPKGHVHLVDGGLVSEDVRGVLAEFSGVD